MAKKKKPCVTPCKECPWRKKAMPGWLGSQFSRQSWVDQAHSDAMVPCHLTLGKGDEGSQCRGMAIYRENVCKLPHGDDRALIGAERDTKNVFASPMEFIEYHGKLGIVSSEIEREI